MRVVSRVIIATALGACASTLAMGAPSGLAATHWMRVDDDNAAPHFPTLSFGENGAMGFMPGCGEWSARVSSLDARLSFAGVTPRHPQCGAESSMAVARSLLDALRRTRSARVGYGGDGDEDDELILLDARGEEVARFARIPD